MKDIENLKIVVSNSYSIAEVLRKLNLKPAGGNYSLLNKYFRKFSIDISHFKKQGWSKGKKFKARQPIENYLIEDIDKNLQSYKLKNKLLKEGLLEKKCYRCLRTTWNELPIPLELEHIDGKNFNNKLENLTLLCPNCHAQTPTYRGKNIGKVKGSLAEQVYAEVLNTL